MFTGIIEEVGRLLSLDFDSPDRALVIQAATVLQDAHPGDSIAVNGVCLTITEHEKDRFSVGVMPETLRRTSLGLLAPGAGVNLERPLQPQSRLGGHFVQGHIDGAGTVASVTADGNALAVRVEAGPYILRYVVEKGFIAIDGASLTVTSVDDAGFGVALVPYSQDHLAPPLTTVGSRVNLEVDILAKYVEKLVIH
jgi:riboflavin synthase